jgi:CRP-like cAMP-binding protein
MDKAKTKEQALAKAPLFSGCTPHELKRVGSLMTQINVPEGTVLARQGQRGNEFMIVLDGTASITRDGKEVATVGPGDYMGEISIIDGGPRTATITATSAMQLEVLTHQEFAGLLDQAPEIARNLLPTLVKRLREAGERSNADS